MKELVNFAGHQLLFPGEGGYSSEFLVGVCRPVLQILTRFQTKKRTFPLPFLDLALRQKLCYHYVAVGAQTKNYSNPFQIRIFLFLSYSFGIETINTFIHSVVPSKTIPDSRPKCIPQSVYPFLDQNGAKTLPDGAAHTYMAYIREYPPPGPKRRHPLVVVDFSLHFCLRNEQ